MLGPTVKGLIYYRARWRTKCKKKAGATAKGPSAEKILLRLGQGIGLILPWWAKGKGVTAFKGTIIKFF
jgi:hypothetical protein